MVRHSFFEGRSTRKTFADTKWIPKLAFGLTLSAGVARLLFTAFSMPAVYLRASLPATEQAQRLTAAFCSCCMKSEIRRHTLREHAIRDYGRLKRKVIRSSSNSGPDRSSSSTSNAGHGNLLEAVWLPKSERLSKTRTDWADGKPLPYLLRGHVHDIIQGVVSEVRESGQGVVKLRWEAMPSGSVPDQYKPPPQLSPLRGLLDAVGFWQPEQPVNVRLRAPAPGEDDSVVPLELAGEQPVHPPMFPSGDGIGTPGTPSDWINVVQPRVGVRVDGLSDSGGQHSVILPAEDWNDTAWSSIMRSIPSETRRKLAEKPTGVFEAWALAVAGRDLVVSGPMTNTERELLLFMPILRSLQAQFPRLVGSGPRALVVGTKSLTGSLKRMLAENGVKAQVLKKGQKSLAVDADVLLGETFELLAAAEAKLGLFQRVAFVAVEDLAYYAKFDKLARLLAHLPSHRWGQSVIWSPRLNEELEPALRAFTHDPAILSIGNSVSNVGVTHERILVSQVAQRIAGLVQRYTRIRVQVFVEDPEALQQSLALSDTEDRLTAPESSLQKVSVVASDKPIVGNSMFDLVVHADPPPSRREYLRRLACARQLAATFVGLEEDGSLHQKWRGFVNYGRYHAASLWTGGAELKRLVQGSSTGKEVPHVQRRAPRAKEARDMWAALEQLDDMQKEKEKQTGELPEFQVKKGGLVWSAGVDDLDTAVAFENGL